MSYMSVKKSNIIYRLRHAKPGSEEEVAALADLRATEPIEAVDEATAASEIGDFVNRMSFDAKKCAAAIGTNHRTLQQGVTRLALAWLRHLSQVEHFDLRNEASVLLARKIVAYCDANDIYIDHLPTI